MLYALCEKYNIPYRRTGKLIVAADEDEISELENILKRANKNSVNDLRIIDESEIKSIEPHVIAKAALYSPSTGIIDAHALINYFEVQASSNCSLFAYKTEVVGIKKINNKYEIKTKKDNNELHCHTSSIVINSAGLHADKIAQMAGINIDKAKYKLYYCKGEYFYVDNSRGKLSSLVYPIPRKELIGLGIHATIDLAGDLRLGPNAFYVDELDYNVNESHKYDFFLSANRYLDFLEKKNLRPGFAGIRPKLQGPGDDFRDFVIAHEEDKGFPGFINLIGIESPGLTCSPAIARHIADIVDYISP